MVLPDPKTNFVLYFNNFFIICPLQTESNNQTIVVIQYYCYLCFITNFGINFALYCVSGQNFRKAVIGMFSSRSSYRHNQEQSGTQITGELPL